MIICSFLLPLLYAVEEDDLQYAAWDERWIDDKSDWSWTWEVNHGGSLLAYGDFTNDGTTDGLSLHTKGGKNLIKLFSYDESKKMMSLNNQFKNGQDHYPLKNPYKDKSDLKVSNIIPVDIDFDGSLDLLVIWVHIGESEQTEYYYQVLLRDRNDDKLWFTPNWESKVSFLVEPLVADLDMDGAPDLLTETGAGIKILFSDKKGYKAPIPWSEVFDLPAEYNEKDEPWHLQNPHGSAIVDINGDCVPDIALVMRDNFTNGHVRYFTSYAQKVRLDAAGESRSQDKTHDNILVVLGDKHDPEHGVKVRWKPLMVLADKGTKIDKDGIATFNFVVDETKKEEPKKPVSLDHDLPPGAGHVTFVDVNADGTIDLIFPVFSKDGYMSIYGIMNRQMPVCLNPLRFEVGCRDAKDMCRICENSECEHVYLEKPVIMYSANRNAGYSNMGENGGKLRDAEKHDDNQHKRARVLKTESKDTSEPLKRSSTDATTGATASGRKNTSLWWGDRDSNPVYEFGPFYPKNPMERANVWLRVADFDNNMYPDVLVNSETEVMLFSNHIANKKGDDESDTGNVLQQKHPREFRLDCKPYAFTDLNGQIMKFQVSSWLDQKASLGWPNIIIQQADGLIKAFQWVNRAQTMSSSYHLTTVGLSGICASKTAESCVSISGGPPPENLSKQSPNGAKNNTNDEMDADRKAIWDAINKHVLGIPSDIKKSGYGQSYPGVVIKIAITNFKGHYISRVETQLSQMSYRALKEPYIRFGLSHCNNYIAEFFAGLSVPPTVQCPVNQSNVYDRTHCRPFRRFSPGYALIPNSSVTLIPTPRSDSDGWQLELGVTPGDKFWQIAITAACILLGLGAVIGFLEIRERKRQQKRQYRDFRVHFINA